MKVQGQLEDNIGSDLYESVQSSYLDTSQLTMTSLVSSRDTGRK